MVRVRIRTSWVVNFALFRCYRPVIYTRPAKFHYTIWFEAGSKLVADLQRAEIWPII